MPPEASRERDETLAVVPQPIEPGEERRRQLLADAGVRLAGSRRVGGPSRLRVPGVDRRPEPLVTMLAR
jgi:hypothetical protein